MYGSLGPADAKKNLIYGSIEAVVLEIFEKYGSLGVVDAKTLQYTVL